MANEQSASIFPNEQSTCEACGYSLQGAKLDDNCPECGSPIADSAPDNRSGIPWQQKATPITWVKTVIKLTLSPRRQFRNLIVGGSNQRDRKFLYSLAILCGLYCATLRMIGIQVPSGILIAVVILAMTYIEAFGVMYFSKQRGWKVPWRLAERLVCYSSIGWIPATLVIAKVWILYHDGKLDHYIPDLDFMSPWILEMVLFIAIFGASTLLFEVLVWTGVRQTRFANEVLKEEEEEEEEEEVLARRPPGNRGTEDGD